MMFLRKPRFRFILNETICATMALATKFVLDETIKPWIALHFIEDVSLRCMPSET